MNRAQLDHVLRAAGSDTGKKRFGLVGSAAIFAWHVDIPDLMNMSREVDLFAFGVSEEEADQVAFEIDDFDTAARAGWSVLIQGPAHYVESEAERAAVTGAGVDPWAGGDRQLFLRITPSRVTGRRVSHSS